MTSAPTPVASTYVAGEDESRLQRTAEALGLSNARMPLRPVREAVTSVFETLSDSTLEAARMHSVGTLANDERVDECGTIHLMTLTRRHGGKASAIPEYRNIMDLFKSPGDSGRRKSQPLEVEEVESEEYAVVDTVEGGSLTAAIFGIVKGTIGPAILYLPRGFKQAGWAVAILALMVSTATYLYSAWRLLECWKIEKEKIARLEKVKALLDDSALGQYGAMEAGGEPSEPNTNGTPRQPVDPHVDDGTMLTYPELSRRAFGKYASFIVSGIAAMQFGVCLTYLIFVPQNLVASYRSITGIDLPMSAFLISMVLVEIPFCWIRDIRRLTPTNMLATLLIAFGLASCLFIALFQDQGDSTLIQNVASLPPIKDTWYLFIGTSFFVFEGSITLIVPLQEAVFKHEDKKVFPSVNNRVQICIVTFYIFFATICWAAFGDGVKTALTASLPDGTISTAVQIAYSIAVIFTFPLQAFPALEVACHTTTAKAGDLQHESAIFKRNVTASLIICSLGVIAYMAIDYLGNVVSILGSLVGIPIALVYPNLMHNILVKNSSKSVRTMNYCVAGLGLFATAAASYITITQWDEGAE